MKYMLLIYHDESTWANKSEAEREQIYAEYRKLIEELSASGHYLAGDQLEPSSTASCVKVRDGKQLVTDGPFAETREQVGGYFVVEVSSQAEANSIAGRIPSARMGVIEIRPVVKPRN